MNTRGKTNERSVWAYLDQHQGHRIQINVSEAERQASLIGGSVLAVCGLLRGSLSGMALLAIGGGFIYRGITGHCHAYQALGYSSAEESGQGRGHVHQRSQQFEQDQKLGTTASH